MPGLVSISHWRCRALSRRFCSSSLTRLAMPRLLHVVGARPNFMKVAPVLRAPSPGVAVEHILVHTGQHYDAAMSETFFDELGIPAPHANLGVGSGSHGAQTGRLLIELDAAFDRFTPEWVVVYGDVNSTLAAALVAAKRGIRIAHVEAGVRSFDRSMPEEINRVLTDQVADLCLTPSAAADENLRREGVRAECILCVGNVMVDTLDALRPQAAASGAAARFNVTDGRFAFATFHRAGNVDDPVTLVELLQALGELAREMPVLFAVHPRTRQRIEANALGHHAGKTQLLDPLGYLETVDLVSRAGLVLTDSGGLQVETTILGTRCLTARPNTEWTETLTDGTNRLVAPRKSEMVAAARASLAARADGRPRPRPPLWDGRTAERIVQAIVTHLPAASRPA